MTAYKPFDADDPGNDGRVVLTIGELVRALREGLEHTFPDIWVEGEISGFRHYTQSGHMYYTLKDPKGQGQLSAVCFRGSARLLKFTPEDGMKVLARGKITVYEARGTMQITVTAMEPAGVGALQLAYEQLKKKLSKEGLFDLDKKKPLPPFPQVIGVVTSPQGAAVHDVLRILKKRRVDIKVLVAPARVQGDGSAAEIARSIALLNRDPRVELILVTRGGGSMEDLWAFNEEVLVRAVANSTLPVLSAVGHEVDTTLCDYAADQVAPTPSGGAELIHPGAAQLEETVARLEGQLRRMAEGLVAGHRAQLSTLLQRGVFQEMEMRLLRMGQHLDMIRDRLRTSLAERSQNLRSRLEACRSLLTPRLLQDRLVNRRQRVEHLFERLAGKTRGRMDRDQARLARAGAGLDLLSPMKVLGRGYAMCRNEKGHVLKTTGQFKAGKTFRITVADGDVDAVATGGQDVLPLGD